MLPVEPWSVDAFGVAPCAAGRWNQRQLARIKDGYRAVVIAVHTGSTIVRAGGLGHGWMYNRWHRREIIRTTFHRSTILHDGVVLVLRVSW